jgi:hypothetical protein
MVMRSMAALIHDLTQAAPAKYCGAGRCWRLTGVLASYRSASQGEWRRNTDRW